MLSYISLLVIDWQVVYGDRLETLDKVRRALDAASAMGVPPVLTAEYIISGECDELSFMTYLTGFHKAITGPLQ